MAVVGLALVLVYAVGSGWWTSRAPGWYAALAKPGWQPPDGVFGVIWPLNFLALGIASWVIGASGSRPWAALFLALLVASSALALLWAFLFYTPPHRLRAAFVALALAAMLACGLPVVAWMVTWWVGLLLMPYAGWLSLAAALSFAYARLNIHADAA